MLGGTKSGVSLAMVARDEETSLPGCLASTRGLFDEIVAVDTGSVDRTREVARAFGATVVEFEWCDDFSAARNAALSRCAHGHIFWLDADEVLGPGSRARLARLMKRGLEPDTAYIMRQVSNRPDGSFGFAEVLSARLFPNHRGVYWTGRAREEILPAARAQGLRTKFVDIPVTHLGFAHPASVLRSLLRDRELLQADLGERPDNPLLLFNLALTHFLIGRCASSLDDVGISRRYLEKLLEGRCESLTPDLEGAVFALLAHAFLALGNIARSLEICEEFRLLHPSDFALVDVEASLLADLGMWERAEALYLRLPQIRDYIHMRDLGHARYHRLVSAKVAAAYHFEGTGQHCRAFLTWSELVDNSAGMFDAARGRRRTALRILRNAILNPMEFLGEIARLRKSGPAPSGPQAGAVAAFRRRNDVPKGSRGRSPTF